MKRKLKALLTKYFSSFVYFYQHLRYRMLIALVISLMVGVLDGFGLAMFLPLLKLAGGSGEVSADQLGSFGFMVDALSTFGIALNLLTILILLVLFFTLKGVFKFFAQAYLVTIRQYFVMKLRLQLARSFRYFSYKAFVRSDVGQIQNTMTGEVARVAIAYQSYYKAFEQLILVLVYAGFAFVVNAQFALLVTVGGGLSNFLYRSVFTRTKKTSHDLSKEGNRLQSMVIQFVANFKYLRATSTLHPYYLRLKDSIKKIEVHQRKIGILNAILFATKEPIIIMIVAVVILLQTRLFGGDLGPILISLLFFYRALGALIMTQNQWNNFLGVSGSLVNTTEQQNKLNAHQIKPGHQKIQGLQKGITLRGVSFSYHPDQPTLQEINLEIPKNATVALVGESGSGKTTLVNLLAGLLHPDEGQVSVDGIDLKEIDLDSYQSRIGYITQDPVIFSDTVFNNVTLWDEPHMSNKERFRRAIEQASLLNFVEELPAQENELLENNGVNLSGGQKQRISIARELYKDIDVLVLDEATSALDSETEKVIQRNLDALKGQYTLIMVAHRLSTIRNADEIVLLKQGRVEKQGSFQELMEKAPSFKRMVELQEL